MRTSFKALLLSIRSLNSLPWDLVFWTKVFSISFWETVQVWLSSLASLGAFKFGEFWHEIVFKYPELYNGAARRRVARILHAFEVTPMELSQEFPLDVLANSGSSRKKEVSCHCLHPSPFLALWKCSIVPGGCCARISFSLLLADNRVVGFPGAAQSSPRVRIHWD